MAQVLVAPEITPMPVVAPSSAILDVKAKGVDPFSIPDPRIDIDRKPKWAFTLGPTETSFNSYPNNNISTNQQTYVATVNNQYTIIDPLVRTVYDVNINMAGTSITGANLYNPGSFDCLRRSPINRMISSQILTINGASVTTQPQQYVNLQSWYESDKLSDTKLSATPQYQDRFSEYRDWLDYGSVKNCCGNFGDNERPLRGAYQYYTGTISSTGASVSYELNEVVQSNPLSWGLVQKKGLIGVTTFKLQQIFDTNQQMILSHCTGAGAQSTITSVSYSLNAAPSIDLVYYDQNPLVSNFDPMKSYFYELLTPNPQNTVLSSVLPGASFTANSVVLQLTEIPRAVLLFAAENFDENQTLVSTDTCAALDRLSLTFMNKQSIFEAASPVQLYDIAVKNGYKGSWLDWSQFSGSPLLLMFGEDIPVKAGEASSSEGKYQVQIKSSTYRSLYRTRTVTFYYFTIPYYEGIFEIKGGMAKQNFALLNPAIIASAKELPRVEQQELRSEAMAGGDFFGNLKSFFTKTVPTALRTAIPVAKQLAPFIPGYGQVISRAADIADKGLTMVGRGGRGRRMRGRGFADECENEGDCGHPQCQGRGGCIACQGKTQQVGNLSKNDLQRRLLGNGLSLEPEQYEETEVIEYM